MTPQISPDSDQQSTQSRGWAVAFAIVIWIAAVPIVGLATLFGFVLLAKLFPALVDNGETMVVLLGGGMVVALVVLPAAIAVVAYRKAKAHQPLDRPRDNESVPGTDSLSPMQDSGHE